MHVYVKVLYFLKLALQTIVSCHVGAKTELGSFGRAAGSFNLWVISPVPLSLLLLYVTSILPTCVSVHPVHNWCPWKPEEIIRFPRTGVRDSCEPPCGCWEIEPRCSRVVSALNSWVISPVPSPVLSYLDHIYSPIFSLPTRLLSRVSSRIYSSLSFPSPCLSSVSSFLSLCNPVSSVNASRYNVDWCCWGNVATVSSWELWPCPV